MDEAHKKIVRKFFDDHGAYVMFDGQYGSTGKGLLASYLGEAAGDMFDYVTTNAGSNSGHTSYRYDKKYVLKQLPTMALWTYAKQAHLNAGAVINPELLAIEEAETGVKAFVHPMAAVIDPRATGEKQDISSTGQGVGPAIQRKLGRELGAVYGGKDLGVVNYAGAEFNRTDWDRAFVEMAQGWSLGINSGFYPYVTARECSPAQGLADAMIPPNRFAKSIVSLRTFPIRVGGNSGPCYPDQEEITFEDIGVEPEYTTVTKKKRRVFTWSDMQFEQMLWNTQPDGLFFNFMNYVKGNHTAWVTDKLRTYYNIMGKPPELVLVGYGPTNKSVMPWTF